MTKIEGKIYDKRDEKRIRYLTKNTVRVMRKGYGRIGDNGLCIFVHNGLDKKYSTSDEKGIR